MLHDPHVYENERHDQCFRALPGAHVSFDTKLHTINLLGAFQILLHPTRGLLTTIRQTYNVQVITLQISS